MKKELWRILIGMPYVPCLVNFLTEQLVLSVEKRKEAKKGIKAAYESQKLFNIQREFSCKWGWKSWEIEMKIGSEVKLFGN